MKSTLLILSFIITINQFLSQASPSAASLGTYGNSPVSQYTGSPNISIPIGSVKEGSLATSVGLSYHQGNLIVNTPASMVGKGWSLIAGGVISREVQDKPDDEGLTGYQNNLVFDLDDDSDHEATHINKDLEPDMYSFNVNGLSGKFYFDKNGHAHCIPRSDIRISRFRENGKIIGFTLIDVDGTNYFFGRFAGRYAIETSSTEQYEYTIDQNGNTVKNRNRIIKDTIITSWHLLAMQDYNLDYNLNFYYEQESYLVKTPARNTFRFKNYEIDESITDDSRNLNGVKERSPTSIYGVNGSVAANTSSTRFSYRIEDYGARHNYDVNLIKGVRLQKIESDLDIIEFEYENAREDIDRWGNHASNFIPYTPYDIPRELNKIITKNIGASANSGNNSFCKEYILAYEYTHDDDINLLNNPTDVAENKNLFLKSIQEVSCDQSIQMPPYELTYHFPDSSNDNEPYFPSRLSKATDEMGYYNGASLNNYRSDNIPSRTERLVDPVTNQVIVKHKGGANRSANEEKAKYGVLTKVQYPTGGSTSYDWEGHRYSFLELSNFYTRFLLEGCEYGELACCNELEDEATYTFSSMEELRNSTFTVNLAINHFINDGGNGGHLTPVGGNDPIDNNHNNTGSPYDLEDFTIEGCNDPTIDGRANMTIEIFETATNDLALTRSFNIQNHETYSGNITFPIKEEDGTSPLQGLTANVNYKFKVTIEGGPGSLKLKTPSIVPDPNKLAPGLRIKRITVEDGIEETDNDIITEFEYTVGNSTESSGERLFEPIFSMNINKFDYAQREVPNSSSWNLHHRDDGVNLPTWARDAYFQRIYFSDQSFMPLSGYNGTPIAYTEVKEVHLPRNGKTIYKFKQEMQDWVTPNEHKFPFTPPIFNPFTGQVSEIIMVDAFNNEVAKTTYTPYDSYWNLHSTEKLYKIGEIVSFRRDNGGFGTHKVNLISCSEYYIKDGYYQLQTIESIKDGVDVRTDYYYNTINPHIAPEAKVTTNSNGNRREEEYSYAFDLVDDSTLADEVLLALNLQNIPLKTEVFKRVNGEKIQTGGVKTKFELFDENGVMNTASYHPLVDVYGIIDYRHMLNTQSLFMPKLYPHVGYKFLGTQNVEDDYTGSWIPTDTLVQYGDGNILRTKKPGWGEQVMTYEDHKLISTSFNGNTSYSDYYPNTRLVSKITSISGEEIDFVYDQFGRLITKTEARGNIITTHSYHMGDIKNDDYPYTRTNVSYTQIPENPVADKAARNYFDGIGRVIVAVDENASVNGLDLVNITHYDEVGKDIFQYQEFEGGNNGQFQLFPDPAIAKYTQYVYELSPLGRLMEVTPPQGEPTYYSYGHNLSTDNVKNLDNGGFFPEGKLFKTTVITPEGKKTITFNDVEGKTVLARTTYQTVNDHLDAYTQYDHKARIIKVIPPSVSTSNTNSVFLKKYDGQGNLIELKSPDKGIVKFRYNSLNQLVAKQTSKLNSLNKWNVFEYDTKGRLIRSGDIDLNGEPNVENLLATNIWNETFYSNSGTSINKVVRQETAMFNGFQLTSNRLVTINDYDTYGRLLRVEKDNHLGGSKVTDNYVYDFAGNIISWRVTQRKTANANPVVIENETAYTPQGIATDAYQTINGHTEHLSHNTFNADGTISQSQNGVNNNGALQTIDYTYEKNHLVGINANPTADDIFSLSFIYETNNTSLTGVNTYRDGKLSAIRWKHRNESWKNYDYGYDYIGRLTEAIYSEGNGNQSVGLYDCSYSYDDQGNLERLIRYGVGYNNIVQGYNRVKVDDLYYMYENNYYNRLERIREYNYSPIYTHHSPGYESKNQYSWNGNEKYLYDLDGNITYDPSRQINILYNYFDLPYEIEKSDQTGKIQWLFDANGSRLQKTVTHNGSITEVTDYIGSFIYTNNDETINGGFYRVNNIHSTPRYDYYIQDHLGNTRAVYSDLNDNGSIEDNEILQATDYYPYGMQHFNIRTSLNNTNASNGHENNYLYNGIEYEFSFDLNLGFTRYRTYDPSMARWYQVDPKGYAVAAYSPYVSMNNNPAMYADPQGDLGIIAAIGIGAVISGIVQGISNHKQGGSFATGFIAGAIVGGVTSAATSGIGSAIGATGSAGKELLRAGAHGMVGGFGSIMQGGSFGSGFLTSVVSSGFGSLTDNASALEAYAAGAASGGITSVISGGNFFAGAGKGLVITALNHRSHNDPPCPDCPISAYQEDHAPEIVRGDDGVYYQMSTVTNVIIHKPAFNRWDYITQTMAWTGHSLNFFSGQLIKDGKWRSLVDGKWRRNKLNGSSWGKYGARGHTVILQNKVNKVANGLGKAGTAIGVLDDLNQYRQGRQSGFVTSIKVGVALISEGKHPYAKALGLGWDIAEAASHTEWYQNWKSSTLIPFAEKVGLRDKPLPPIVPTRPAPAGTPLGYIMTNNY